MHGAHVFLQNLAMVLCVAAVTTVVFQLLRQPVVLGYLIAGLIIGPHVSIPLVADEATIQTLAELGVILLMFSIGLEFSFRKLARVGPTAGLVAVIQVGIMIWLGYLTARAFGWTTREGLFTGALIAISSTTIIAKVFEEQRVTGPMRELVFGVLIVEDLIAILLLAMLTGVASGAGLSTRALLVTTGQLGLFLVLLVVIGLLVVPRLVRRVVRLDRTETTLVASIGICFAVALLASAAGYSVALGAFLAGSLIAESGVGAKVEHLVMPVRDMFAAIFFVAVGMMINPTLVLEHWQEILVLTAVVVGGKLLGVSIGAFLAGTGTRDAVRAGMSLAQIGEFSFIIAGLGLSLGATRPFLYPVAVTVSALTTLLTPWLIRGSDRVALWIDRKLPRPIQTFASLYSSWIEELRTRAAAPATRSRRRRLVRMLIVDALLLSAIVIGAATSGGDVAESLSRWLGLREALSGLVVLGVAATVAAPFGIGLLRCVRALGVELAVQALPEVDAGTADLAAAPLRAFAVALQLAILLAVVLPLLAITQPFLAGVGGLWILLPLLGVLGVLFWRSATNLEHHVRAGAELLAEAMAGEGGAHAPADGLSQVRQLLPGLGSPTLVEVQAHSPAAGKSLAEINLRGRTGATVLAIARDGETLLTPRAEERLRPGDVVAMVGARESVEAARALLISIPAP